MKGIPRSRSDYCYQSDSEGDEPSTRVKLDKLGLMIKQKFSLHYDFGDDWMFTITVQNITETAEKTAPRVIKENGIVTKGGNLFLLAKNGKILILANRISTMDIYY